MKKKKKVHNRLQVLRLDSGMNQIEMSKVLGCTQATLSRIERNILKLDIQMLKRLKANFEDLDIWWFIDNFYFENMDLYLDFEIDKYPYEIELINMEA